MATVTDVEVANASFPNVRQDLNDILEAITTNFSADAEPTTTYPNQFWYETDTNLLYLRNEANDAWITLASIDQTSGEWEPRTAVIQAIDAAGLSFKTDEGTTRVEIADDGSVTVNTSLDVDNIKIDGNTISSTDTNGDINITPDGTGKVVIDGLNYPTADGSDGQVLTTDGAGNIAFETAAGGGITQADIWRLTANTNLGTGTEDDITANLARSSDATSGLIGSGMTESSGIFTFPETGIYLITANALMRRGQLGVYEIQVLINVSTDSGSNYDDVSTGFSGITTETTSANNYGQVTTSALVDVTNASTFRVKFSVISVNASTVLKGGASANQTHFAFIRLGDT